LADNSPFRQRLTPDLPGLHGPLPGIQQFLDHLRVERELTPATVEAYGRDLDGFSHFASGRTIAAAETVRSIDVLDFLVHLTERELSPRSQARRLIALRQLFKFFQGERIVAVDPTEDVDLPRFGRKLPDSLTVEEVDHLLAAPDRRTPRGARDAAIIETLYATGCACPSWSSCACATSTSTPAT
jgi:integrase/recombinase XerD